MHFLNGIPGFEDGLQHQAWYLCLRWANSWGIFRCSHAAVSLDMEIPRAANHQIFIAIRLLHRFAKCDLGIPLKQFVDGPD